MKTQQRGYLLLAISVILIFLGLASSLLVSMYISTNRATLDTLASHQALYIAKAGLEIAKRDLFNSTLTCAAISTASKYSNTCYPPGSSSCSGYFTVTGSTLSASTTLSTAVSSTSSTTIVLTSISGFLTSGVIYIDSEAIWYSGISGTQLQNVVRGFLGTTASTHAANSTVTQSGCLLTATAGVPSIATTSSQRVVQDMVWKTGGNVIITGMSTATPLISAQTVSLADSATVTNSLITDTSVVGSTIISGTNTVINGSAKTVVGTTTVSTAGSGNIKADVSQNNSYVSTTNDLLWYYFFSQSKTALRSTLSASSKVITSGTTYDFSQASGTVWVDGSFDTSGTTGTIGSASSPVTIIINGNANINKAVTMYGMLYVINGLATNVAFVLYGQAVAEGAVNLHSAAKINLSPISQVYNSYYLTREIFS